MPSIWQLWYRNTRIFSEYSNLKLERSNIGRQNGVTSMVMSIVVQKPGEITLQQTTGERGIQASELKIRTLIAGICGSDVSVFKGRLAHATYPVVAGHEVVGEIIEAGKDTAFTVGEKVVIVPNSFCDTCGNCRIGKRNICLNKKSLGVNEQGIFQEEFVIEEKYALRIHDGMPLERAVLTEPLAVIVHAFEHFEKNAENELLIIGCGSEGMLAVSLASYYGMNVSVCDINADKLALMNEHLPQVKTLSPEQVEGHRFDYVLECAGVSATVEQAVRVVKAGGKVVLVGMPPTANLPIVHIVRNEITLVGSIIYSFPQDFQRSLDILADDRFIINHAIVAPRDMTQFEAAYNDACSGKYGKILFKFTK